MLIIERRWTADTVRIVRAEDYEVDTTKNPPDERDGWVVANVRGHVFASQTLWRRVQWSAP
jgi:hypothetical protein